MSGRGDDHSLAIGIDIGGTKVAGGVVGAVLANVMFDRRVFEIATKDRITTGHLVGEVVATAGLIAVIFGPGPQRPGRAVGRSGRGVYRCGVLVHQQHVIRHYLDTPIRSHPHLRGPPGRTGV